MDIIELKKGFSCFSFSEIDGFDYGFNIYGIRSGKGVLLIDTAFRSQILTVQKHLTGEGLEVTHVVASHFHNDHIAGLMVLPETVQVLGSPEYGKTLSKDIPQRVAPVSFTEPLEYGDHVLRFIPAPGHSPCSILIDVNGEDLHAGDNLMSRYDGKRILPWVQKDNIREHIRSLEKLKGMGRERILLSHGPMLEGKKRIAEEIDLRLFYLKNVLDPGKNLTLAEALPDAPENWVSTEFFSQLMEEYPQLSQQEEP